MSDLNHYFSKEQIERIKPSGRVPGEEYVTDEQVKAALITGNFYSIRIKPETIDRGQVPKRWANKTTGGKWTGVDFEIRINKSPEGMPFEDVTLFENVTVNGIMDTLNEARNMTSDQLDVLQGELEKYRKRAGK